MSMVGLCLRGGLSGGVPHLRRGKGIAASGADAK
jgi:hypothetical protein